MSYTTFYAVIVAVDAEAGPVRPDNVVLGAAALHTRKITRDHPYYVLT
jgi:hypothetical protein